jgi:predicted acetyltransferase
MLRLALRVAHDRMGLDRVLVTCNDDNVGSIRTIERNGGVLEDITSGADVGQPTRRYWIDARHA